MRADLERIKKMIDDFQNEKHSMPTGRLQDENSVLRELLTAWQGMYTSDYQSDVKLHLNMLTKLMLEGD